MEKHDEKWLLSKGWTKKKGYRIDINKISSCSDCPVFYMESLSDLEGIEECEFYELIENEFATHDLEEAINQQEEIDNIIEES